MRPEAAEVKSRAQSRRRQTAGRARVGLRRLEKRRRQSAPSAKAAVPIFLGPCSAGILETQPAPVGPFPEKPETPAPRSPHGDPAAYYGLPEPGSAWSLFPILMT